MKKMHIGQILPIETYSVTGHGTLSTEHLQALTHLYQPLVGLDAVGLYLTLSNDLSISNDEEQATHHALMTYLGMPLDRIYTARLRLEAIGLLRTWKNEDIDELASYQYQIQLPFTPRNFLTDGVLSQLLRYEIGEDKYEKLEATFERRYPDTSITGNEVTVNFKEVFETSGKLRADVDAPLSQKEKVGPNITASSMDLNWIEHLLKQRKLPVSEILTPANKTN
ncbi:replication initiation and membrane attachment family protein [Radiobacillus deserti]|uniref:Replicative helicase loading/DNA remodeling protein DnaB N-terminal winged helix domain-containing protein n=1 Tax=Radiobacillus deserti TaxID=2594883 RepID=A0A516KHE7_9BACI|nr:hypothetical protein [Radiobacillus deserti]QDP40828.1 hypothetical protein FN924_11900 [Radiobacillus deserti]